MVTNSYGIEILYDAAANLMEGDLREEIHGEIAPYTKQEFFDEYCKRYKERYGEPWELDTAHPQY